MKNNIKKLTLFSLNLLLNAIGICLITKAFLGTAPLSSLPFVLSLGLPPSFGELTFLSNMLFLLGQVLIQKKDFPPMQFLQIPVTILFSSLIDLHMALFQNLTPDSYIGKFLLLLLGCSIMAFGIVLGILADFLLTPGNAFVQALSKVTHQPFGNIKVYFDMFLMISAVISSFILFGKFRGVGIGTLISAFLVGTIVNFYQKLLRQLSIQL